MADKNRIIFKFGSYQFPNNYINWDTIKIKPKQRQDLDSYTDLDGVTHRNALEHTKSQVQFSTRPLRESQVNEIMDGITSSYIDTKQRDANCEYFNPEDRDVSSGHFYLDPSMEFSIKGMDNTGEFLYDPIDFLFIEY